MTVKRTVNHIRAHVPMSGPQVCHRIALGCFALAAGSIFGIAPALGNYWWGVLAAGLFFQQLTLVIDR